MYKIVLALLELHYPVLIQPIAPPECAGSSLIAAYTRYLTKIVVGNMDELDLFQLSSPWIEGGGDVYIHHADAGIMVCMFCISR